MTTWYQIADFPGYKLSIHAEVLSLKGAEPRILKPKPAASGYLQVTLRRDGKSYTKTIHTLMAQVFLGPCPAGMQVLHGPQGKLCNNLSNLRYGTPSENVPGQPRGHYETNRIECDHGHPFTPGNVYWRKGRKGKLYRKCKKCQVDANKRYRDKALTPRC